MLLSISTSKTTLCKRIRLVSQTTAEAMGLLRMTQKANYPCHALYFNYVPTPQEHPLHANMISTEHKGLSFVSCSLVKDVRRGFDLKSQRRFRWGQRGGEKSSMCFLIFSTHILVKPLDYSLLSSVLIKYAFLAFPPTAYGNNAGG